MCDINSTSFYPEPSLGRKSPFIDVKRQIRGRMITVENSLKSGANKRRLGEKLWLVFVLANAVLFLVAVCISVFWPSELPKFVSSLTIVSGLALIYAYLIEWCLDALASKQSKSALEILECDNDKLREENNELQKELDLSKRKLEDTQKELGLANLNADNALYARDTARDIAKGVISERNGLRTERDELLAEIDKLKRENFALREELGDTDDALVESCSQLASVCSKLDDLQSKLSKLVAERNQLQAEVEAEINNLNKKLTAANAGFQWYQGECISAKRSVNHAKQQIADLEGALKKAISALPKETHGDE